MIWFKTWDQLRLLTKSCMIVASTGTRILDCLHRKSAPHISWRWDSHITSACGFWGGIWQILHPNPTTSYLYLHQDLRNYSPFQHFCQWKPISSTFCHIPNHICISYHKIYTYTCSTSLKNVFFLCVYHFINMKNVKLTGLSMHKLDVSNEKTLVVYGI